MEDFARKSGFSVAELFGGRRGNGGKVAPKYRNRPTWIVEAGGNIDRFLIS
jgi:hypothetical protein